MKLLLVWNESKTHCVGFANYDEYEMKIDAEHAAGRITNLNFYSTLSESFREIYADDEQILTVTEIELPD
ncbi:hypothetical protein [Xenorhabdus sp. Sc-CR9]|uniref:hypothetical protein n=1 Tax=Xenorhabdus sp. Sc-CR9 TaxID=2584468 RepID=UPI001F16C268|nr:hypothetical protein [Xenorhabdus sp. Sc-CR9]